MPNKPADSLFWKFDGFILNALGFVGLFAGLACSGWAALVLLMQVLGWLRASGAEETAAQVTGQLTGVRKIVVWLLVEWPLVGALLASALAFFVAAGAALGRRTPAAERATQRTQ